MLNGMDGSGRSSSISASSIEIFGDMLSVQLRENTRSVSWFEDSILLTILQRQRGGEIILERASQVILMAEFARGRCFER
jgi:hypothetical protein